MEMNALVVDDSGIMRKMVMRSLTETALAEFKFTEARDGLDALEKFNDSVDIMFVDWNMPNMSGIDFLRKVRDSETEHTPAVMITTESTMGKVEEALDEVGVDCFIVKPFTPESLKVKLSPLFEKLTSSPQKAGFFSRLAAKLD
ncbi:MAG: response regulator [Planctomycetes bacterium]|nr:response regulator [Planctomycetota bacterium]